MAFQEIKKVKITGIAACVPRHVEDNINLEIFHSKGDYSKFIKTTGVERRRIAKSGICASDLCVESAEQLISELGWDKNEIECMVFASHSPDYIYPATSCILQDRLKLSSECMCFDISLGCSGWVYGLSTLASIVSASKFKKALLLTGDITSRTKSPQDKSTYPLFGDAGTATALEYCETAKGIKTHLATEGKSHKAIIIEDGGHRNPFSLESLKEFEFDEGIIRNRLQTNLDGMSVFSFGISKAPQSVRALLARFSLNKNEIDFFVFHQANKFMNETIRNKLGISLEKAPSILKDFGNTSSASIPLTIVCKLHDTINNSDNKSINILACGFGVGLSYGSVLFSLEYAKCCSLIEL